MVIVMVIMAMVMIRNKYKGLIAVDKWRLAMVNDGCLMDHQCLIDGQYGLMMSFNHGYQWLFLSCSVKPFSLCIHCQSFVRLLSSLKASWSVLVTTAGDFSTVGFKRSVQISSQLCWLMMISSSYVIFVKNHSKIMVIE